MKKFLKYPLNIQLFAEDGGAGGEGGNPTPPTPVVTPTQQDIDYGKIEEIVNKRSASTADSALKGILKEKGLSGEELDQAITTYKAQKEQERIAKEERAGTLETENVQLKQQILDSKIEVKLTSLAAAEGVSTEKLPFLSKLINREGIADDKGEVLEDKLKEAMNTVIKAFPDMKGTQQAGGFQQIGAPSNEGGAIADASVAAFQNGRIVLPKK